MDMEPQSISIFGGHNFACATRMGMDLHHSTKSKPPITGPRIETADFWDQAGDHVDHFHQDFDEKPSIAEFNIFISDSDTESTTDCPYSIQSSRHPTSVYEFPIEKCLFTAKRDEFSELSPNKDPKKCVRFSQDTVFVERNMDSPFWRELADRKIRRKMLKEQRRRRRQHRSMTLFDLMRILFSKKTHSSINSYGKNLREKSSSALQQRSKPPSADLNPNSLPCTSSSNKLHPTEPADSKRKNSKVHKILHSMQIW